MYCLIQFYVQMRNTEHLAPNQPFLKILAIKLVIFLSFWQSVGISVGTSTLEIIRPNEVLAYPDIKVGIPSLLLCFEMACFAVLHFWAFPWRIYSYSALGNKKGGPLGIGAIWDAVNVWDVAKGFGRGVRWLFVGAKRRGEDPSYQVNMEGLSSSGPGRGKRRGFDNVTTQYSKNLDMSHDAESAGAQDLPIANQFRASQWYDRRHQFRKQLGISPAQSRDETVRYNDGSRSPYRDESAGLILNAQPNPGLNSPSPYGHPLQQQQYQMPRSPLSGGGVYSPRLSPPTAETNIHRGRDTRHMSVSSMGSESLTLSNQWSGSDGIQSHEDRRPSYVSMDTELYTVATPMNMAGHVVDWRSDPKFPLGQGRDLA